MSINLDFLDFRSRYLENPKLVASFMQDMVFAFENQEVPWPHSLCYVALIFDERCLNLRYNCFVAERLARGR